MPFDAESLFVHYTISGEKLSAIKSLSNGLELSLAITEQGGATNTFPLLNLRAENLPETKQAHFINIAQLANKRSGLQVRVSGVANKSSLIASLGHINALSEKSLPKFLERDKADEQPVAFALSIHPNPFTPSTQIRFSLPNDGVVVVRVYDASGRMVRELSHGFRAAGEHTLAWDGRDDLGKTVASGAYFSEVRFGEERKVAKMMLVR